jgi:peptidoglycan/LPS O-acetylase OafA/YrhL
MSSLYYIPRFDWKTGSIVDLIGDITINWDFWLHDELHFWYVPATMMLYMFAPFYMNLVRRHPMYRWLPVAMMIWCCMVQWVGPIHQTVGHIEIFWSRVPIFFIGINVGEMIRKKQQMESSSWGLILLLFAMTLGTCIYLEQVLHGKFPLFIERMIYIPLTISSVLVLTKVFTWLPSWGLRALRFVGGISLEIYLIHCQFVLLPLEKHKWGYWLTFLACMAITIPLAWGLQKIINLLTKRVKL